MLFNFVLLHLQPYGFDVGQSERGTVLKGLDLGVQGMKVGGQVRPLVTNLTLMHVNKREFKIFTSDTSAEIRTEEVELNMQISLHKIINKSFINI